MGGQSGQGGGPDLAQGVEAASLAEGAPLLGHVGEDAVVLVRRGPEVFALGAACTHYGGPLAEGLVVGETLRCPWHHACFSLRTGQTLGGPALNPVACYRTARQGNRVLVTGKAEPAPPPAAPQGAPGSIVIVGTGAAGIAAAVTLRREGYAGALTMVGADHALPYDRPNASKDYLAGTAPEQWMPLFLAEFYREQRIVVRTGSTVQAVDVKARQARLADGSALPFDRLLLATGAEPLRLQFPGSDAPHVLTLRSLADSRAIIARALSAKRAVVIGASFIGLEVAAALRARGLEVAVVGKEARPLERVLGAALGDLLQGLHEQNGVRFHLQDGPAAVNAGEVVLESGVRLPAELVVMGVGVRPAVSLAQQAGLAVDQGVLVNEFLETSAPGIYAAGDIARWPDPRWSDPPAGGRLRVEHWAVAQRQGMTAARNLLGRREPFRSVPFFWSSQFGLTVCYVGHGTGADEVRIAGSLEARDCTVSYWSGGKVRAVATLGRDLVSLKAEAALEQDDQAALAALAAQ